MPLLNNPGSRVFPMEQSYSEFVWGTVQFENPLSIRLDGETSPIGVAIDSLVNRDALQVGMRVRCEFDGRRLIVWGVAGGLPKQADHGRFGKRDPQTIPNRVNTIVSFNEQISNTFSISANADNTVWTINRAGVWIIGVRVRWGGGGSEHYLSLVFSDQTDFRFGEESTGYTGTGLTISRHFNAGDQVSALAFQASGGDMEIKPFFHESTSIDFTFNGVSN